MKCFVKLEKAQRRAETKFRDVQRKVKAEVEVYNFRLVETKAKEKEQA